MDYPFFFGDKILGDKMPGDTTRIGVGATAGDNTNGAGATGAIDSCTCTTAMSGALFRRLSVTTSSWKRC